MRSPRRRLVVKRGVGRWVSGEFGREVSQSTGARVAIEDEMGLPMDVDLIAGREFDECAGFCHGG